MQWIDKKKKRQQICNVAILSQNAGGVEMRWKDGDILEARKSPDGGGQMIDLVDSMRSYCTQRKMLKTEFQYGQNAPFRFGNREQV